MKIFADEIFTRKISEKKFFEKIEKIEFWKKAGTVNRYQTSPGLSRKKQDRARRRLGSKSVHGKTVVDCISVFQARTELWMRRGYE